MKVFVAVAAVAALLPALVSAQAAAWAQCGGSSYSGETTCVSGYTCTKMNEYYSQCTPSTSTSDPCNSEPDASKPETSKPEASKTEASKTETSKPEASKTEASKTETSGPETSKTEASKTETSKPEASKTEASKTEASKTETSKPEASYPGAHNPGTAATCSGTTKFKYFGVNEAGAEFGGNVIPGELGTHYTWPTTSSIDYFLGLGMNTFRITFLMERLTPPAQGLAGTMDATYLAALKNIATYVTGKGAYAIIDPHNYGRYNGEIITDTTAFGKWCGNLANEFKSDSNIIFDTNNEYHDMDQTLVFNLNQACINGIRAAGATSQLILVEGNSYTGAWTWVSCGNADSLINLQDPNDNIAYEMHQYLDSDGSGTAESCVSSTIGVERLTAATNWLKQNGKKGFIGELGAGSNDDCIAAVYGALCSMQQAGGVWIGALWWAAGPWWGTYFQSIEPPNGISISRILPEALMPFI